ncbi:MAG: hypothetical protein R3E08_01865 [Thiotrichaceae bacterium]
MKSPSAYTAKIESNSKQLYLQATLKSAKDGVFAKIVETTFKLHTRIRHGREGQTERNLTQYLPDEQC